ncbi:MAG: hypothetical protein IJS29_08895 [Selenomonadaceae bacterium]|nr:hypothetical protein [Selenomonadaceae bacterium]
MANKTVDIRKETVKAFNFILKKMEDEQVPVGDVQLCIITNFGCITCKLASFESDDQTNADKIAKLSLKFCDKLLEENATTANVINDCDTLILKDVILMPFANPEKHITYSSMVLFSNQIVGVSLVQPLAKDF